MSPTQLRRVCHSLRRGGIIAYPTEAVWGLGCDPRNAGAVRRLLALKQRPMYKGLILVADNLQVLSPWLLPLPEKLRIRIQQPSAHPITWVLAAHPRCPRYLRGKHDTLAVRLSIHPAAHNMRNLCRQWRGPLVSTSANFTGHVPARSLWDLRRSGVLKQVDDYLPGLTGGLSVPSEIRDPGSGKVIRSGL
ncbi:L-threonylcarbamoyladenylate synthase [Candidatus Venteria ishoeyi]|uniref:Threonylcarbamoyl-AMP synthase n=1 Tax=Candidatus Venteria ishoeyi TaxID=1899563 RepID=A0A1H6FI00_9GAMM|nr:Sua5/YciO/YrdC/YwlC family protein [Candidatus Venteria ishoeyi]SEH09051.1 Threonylcarbamoyl-AMP synthase [Candidatus Venteria ishoeyi]